MGLQLPCMPMPQMPSVTGKALFDRIKIHFPAPVFFLEGFQTAFEPPLVACAEPPYYFACIGQVKPPAKIIHALGNREKW